MSPAPPSARTITRLVALAALLNLAACAHIFAPAAPPLVREVPVTLETPAPLPAITPDIETDYLKLASQLRQSSASELAAEGEIFARAYATRRSEANRLRLALFLAVVPAPMGDRARALNLLDVPPNEANGRGRTHPLAQLLLPALHELRRAEDSAAATQQKLRDQQQAFDAMRQKLEALREIELRIQERPKTP